MADRSGTATAVHARRVAAMQQQPRVPNSNWREIKMIDVPVADSLSLKPGDMLVGYLFSEPLEQFVEGTGSHSLPISGPTFIEQDVAGPLYFRARCAGCGDHSSHASRHSPERIRYMMGWAREHRCKRRLELQQVDRNEYPDRIPR